MLAADELSPEAQRYHDFFDPLIAGLVRIGFADRAVRDYGHEERLFPSRLHRGIGQAAAFGKGTAYVGLRIRMGGKALTKRVYDEIEADRASIEAELADVPDVRWSWHRHDHFTYSCINFVRDGAIHDPPDRLAETQEWMLDMLTRLGAVFDPRLAAILAGPRAGQRVELLAILPVPASDV